MSVGKKFSQFCQRNIVMLTLVPIIFGIHWTWSQLQNVPYLVKPEEKKELPIIIVGVQK